MFYRNKQNLYTLLLYVFITLVFSSIIYYLGNVFYCINREWWLETDPEASYVHGALLLFRGTQTSNWSHPAITTQAVLALFILFKYLATILTSGFISINDYFYLAHQQMAGTTIYLRHVVILFSGLTGGLIFHVVYKQTRNIVCGIISLVALLVSEYFIYYSYWISPENAVLFAAACFLVYISSSLVENISFKQRFFLGNLVIAGLILTKIIFIPFIPLYWVMEFYYEQNMLKKGKNWLLLSGIGLAGLCIGLVIPFLICCHSSPWCHQFYMKLITGSGALGGSSSFSSSWQTILDVFMNYIQEFKINIWAIGMTFCAFILSLFIKNNMLMRKYLQYVVLFGLSLLILPLKIHSSRYVYPAVFMLTIGAGFLPFCLNCLLMQKTKFRFPHSLTIISLITLIVIIMYIVPNRYRQISHGLRANKQLISDKKQAIMEMTAWASDHMKDGEFSLTTRALVNESSAWGVHPAAYSTISNEVLGWQTNFKTFEVDTLIDEYYQKKLRSLDWRYYFVDVVTLKRYQSLFLEKAGVENPMSLFSDISREIIRFNFDKWGQEVIVYERIPAKRLSDKQSN